MGLTSFYIGYGLAFSFSLLISVALTEDSFAFDCYSDTGFGQLERLYVLNCTRKGLTSVDGLSTWLTKHITFSRLLTKPRHDFVIRYDYNEIQSVTPFPWLPRARLLSLSHNHVTDIANGAFTNLTNLNELDLSHNEITDKTLISTVFRGNFNKELYEPLPIRILNLSGNKIHALSRNAFEHLQNLERLDLSNNPVKIIQPTTQLALSTLTRLRWLDLSYTQLKKLPADMLRHMPVETLYLIGNKFEVIPKELSELQRTLSVLNLNNNLMMEVGADDFGAMDNLAELEINGMLRLRRIESGAFSQLSSLKKFVCSYNPLLTDIGASLFHHAPDEVVMRNNALSTLAKDVTQWENVRILDVQSNPWNCDCQIGWLVSLLAVRSFMDTESFMDVKCKDPDWLQGYRLDSLAQHYSAMCQFTRASGQAASTLSTNKTNLHITLFFAIIFIVAAVLAFLIRSGRVSLRSLRFLKNDRVQHSRLHMDAGQSSIRYQKAEQLDKTCEMVEMKRDYTNATCV